MYTKRIQLFNCGPISKLDIEFPFMDGTPKPVVLVGENGSGKSILLSHIVNGLIDAKGASYPETPEVEIGKVYKIRSKSYIRPKNEYYFGRVEFDEGFFASEIITMQNKQQYDDVPEGIIGTSAKDIWEIMEPGEYSYYLSNFHRDSPSKIRKLFENNCVLYFPFNRFEEPAWLNEENLKAKAHYMDLKHAEGQTSRKIISSSPLHDNQNWLFDVLYDRAVLETKSIPLKLVNGGNKIIIQALGYSGDATRIYETVTQIVRMVTRQNDVQFGVGKRIHRVLSIESETGQLVSNIFQLSSGETSLLDLFLSILRDFDLCSTPFSSAAEIRGIVVVDEIDLHLHAVHQYEVLPSLMKMFPKVQFMVTTHSPLFVLGMHKVFGEDGFVLYRMPQGHRIDPEEFSEFHVAYNSFTETRKFINDMRAKTEKSQKPLVLVEGKTDINYIQKASCLLGEKALLESFNIQEFDGSSNLATIWKAKNSLVHVLPQKTLLLFDCDEGKEGKKGKQRVDDNKGNLFQRIIPLQTNNPIQEGIENLFSKETLEKAQQHEKAFIDIEPERTKIKRGKPIFIPCEWTINDNEKRNLCDWLCENGTPEDFKGFQIIFKLLKEVLGFHSE